MICIGKNKTIFNFYNKLGAQSYEGIFESVTPKNIYMDSFDNKYLQTAIFKDWPTFLIVNFAYLFVSIPVYILCIVFMLAMTPALLFFLVLLAPYLLYSHYILKHPTF